MAKATVVIAIEGSHLGEPEDGNVWTRDGVQDLAGFPDVTVAEVNGKLVATKTLAAPVQRWEYVEVRPFPGGSPTEVTRFHPDGVASSRVMDVRANDVVTAQLKDGWEPCGIASSVAGLVRAFRRRVQ